MKARDIIPYVPVLLENELGLSISLLFRDELILIKKIIDRLGFHQLYHSYLISKEIEAKIDPTVISLLMGDVQRVIAYETNMAILTHSAEHTLPHTKPNPEITLSSWYRDMLLNLTAPVPITVSGKEITLENDGTRTMVVHFIKRRKVDDFPDYKWYQAPGDKLGGKLK